MPTDREQYIKDLDRELAWLSDEQHRLHRLANAIRRARSQLHYGADDPTVVAFALERERQRIGGATETTKA